MKVAQLRSYCVALRVESFELRGTDDAATAAAHKASESESLGILAALEQLRSRGLQKKISETIGPEVCVSALQIAR